MSVLGQHFIHASLIRIRHEPKSPVLNKTKQKQPLKQKRSEKHIVLCYVNSINTRAPVIGRRGARLSHLDRLVAGSRITIHSFTSPNLQKYSFKPSAGIIIKKNTLEFKNNKNIKRIILNHIISEATIAEGAGRTAVSL